MLGDLKQLRAFLSVARLGNFTRSAYELNISPSTLTVQIQQLEAQLNVTLFDRNRRRVNLTSAGQELLPRAEHVIQEIENRIEQARDISGTAYGTVTVAALPSLAASLLPRAIKILTQQHPHISVRIRDAVAVQVVNIIRNGEVDLGVGCAIKRDRELEWESLLLDRVCAFVAVDHPLSSRKGMSLTELVRHPLIMPVRESSIRMRFETAIERQGIIAIPAYEAVYNSTVLALAAEGLGVAVLSELLVGHGNNTGRLHQIDLQGASLDRHIGILKPIGRSLSRPAQLFSEALKHAAGMTT